MHGNSFPSMSWFLRSSLREELTRPTCMESLDTNHQEDKLVCGATLFICALIYLLFYLI